MNINILSRRSLGDCFARYCDWLATTRRYAERSKREYRDDVSGVIQYLEDRCRIRSATMVRREHLTRYLAHCVTLHHVASTRRRSVAAIRSFFAFVVTEKIISVSPARDLLPPEREERPPRVLSEAEYTRLRAAAADHPRDAAIIEVALQTGLRLLEIARLRLVDVVLPSPASGDDGDVGHVRVIGRGTHGRTVTLNAPACAALRAYLAEREPSASPALFLTRFDHGIGPRGIENVVAKHMAAAGITGASVQTLRHTMAVAMLRRGAHPAVVGTALGHATAEAMGVYVDLARGAMDEEMQRAAL